MSGAAQADCREVDEAASHSRVRWLASTDADDATVLARWCAAVGGPVFASAEEGATSTPPPRSLAIIGWNVKGGAGELGGIVEALRAGHMSEGRSIADFVLLLQEAVRVGGSVPATLPRRAISPRPVGAPTPPARSIEAVAGRAGLHVLYVPSMRNGPQHPEDRGNAILSTLPLHDPIAIELPYERQRRVAVSVRVFIASAEGGARSVRLVSVHLDNTSRATRFWRSFGTGRARQALRLLQPLDGLEHVVLSGDFNTWYGETDEEAVLLLRRLLPAPVRLPIGATYSPPYGLPERQVDYLMFRLPTGWRARVEISADRWGSDHSPLIGWLEPTN